MRWWCAASAVGLTRGLYGKGIVAGPDLNAGEGEEMAERGVRVSLPGTAKKRVEVRVGQKWGPIKGALTQTKAETKQRVDEGPICPSDHF